MPEYHFTGAYPRVLAGLSQGVNAWQTPTPPYGATIEAFPGDAIRTDAPYDHPELEEVEAAVPIQLVAADSTPEQIASGLQTVQDAAAQGADGIAVLQAAAAPVEAPADPAHEAMTAEGAPAPTEPTAN